MRRIFLHDGLGRAARRRIHPAATDNEPGTQRVPGGLETMVVARRVATPKGYWVPGLANRAAGFSPSACWAAAELSVAPGAMFLDPRSFILSYTLWLPYEI